LFSNPAQLPYGGGFHRWLGLKSNFIAGKESVDFARNFQSNKTKEAGELVDAAFDAPIHFGASSSLAWLTQRFGMTAFYRAEPDMVAKKIGSDGLPELRFQAEGYGGAVVGMGHRLTPWLSLGLTAKYLLVAEPDVAVSIADQTAIEELQSPTGLQKHLSYGQGMGFDGGLLLFRQGHSVDLLLAAKVDDIGNTKFTGSQKPFKQTMSAGLGITFHSTTDALHLSADLRDIGQAYGESMYKRLYLGAKLMLRTYVGLAMGMYQGYPTAGAVVDLVFVRVGATVYGREYGDHASLGVEPRNMYVLTFAVGK
jgi:hypothetical protein